MTPPGAGRSGEPDGGWAVIDVETSGFRPGQARIISIAVLGLDAAGRVEQSVVSLLNPGVDPGPTHVHGLTTAMLEDQPQFGDIVGDVVKVLRGRTLVAHNVAFDYSFLAAEAELAEAALPVDSVMCTVELARRLDLGIDNLRLETLAAHWGVTQERPHDAFDDAMVLTGVLAAALRSGARTRHLAAGASGDPTPVAQRPGDPRRAAAAEGAGVPDALPLSEPGAATSGAGRWSRACGSHWPPRCGAPTRSWSSGSCMPGWPTPTLSTKRPR